MSGSDFVSVMTSCDVTGVNTRKTQSTDRGVKVGGSAWTWDPTPLYRLNYRLTTQQIFTKFGGIIYQPKVVFKFTTGDVQDRK